MRSIAGALAFAVVLSGCVVSLVPDPEDTPAVVGEEVGIDAGPGALAPPSPVAPGVAVRLPWSGPLDNATAPPPAPASPPPGPPTSSAPTPTPSPPAPPPTPMPSANPSPAPPPSPAPADPRLRLVAGADAAPSRYVRAFVLSHDASVLDVELLGVPEARVHVGSLFLLENGDGRAHAVELRASSAPPPSVLEARFFARDASGALLGTLDLLGAPTQTLALDLPPAGSVTFSWAIALASGAGADNATFDVALGLTAL